jgi:hypothetical protein
MRSIKMFIIALVAVPMIMISSCNKQSSEKTARVKFNLTDAPAQFDALNIDVRGIQIHTEANGWVSLQSSLGVINILNYVNGATTVIAEGDISAGNIDRVNLILGSNNSVVVNGVTYALQNSAALQAGLNINLNTNLAAQGNYEWTIDFDAVQSVLASGSGSFNFTPTIRLVVNPVISASVNINGSSSASTTGTVTVIESGSATTSGSGSVVVNGSTTGNISGSINTALGLAYVCVTGSDGASVCTMTDLSGHFNIQAISSGTYSIQIDPVLPLLSTHTVSNITVAAGQTTNVGLLAF